MKPLYELTAELERLLDEADQAITETGILPPELDARLAEVEVNFERKVDYCARAVKNLAAEEDALRAEAQRLQRRAQSAERRADWLKAYLRNQMTLLGLDKVRGNILSVTLRKAGMVLAVDAPDMAQSSIPFDWWKPLPPVLDRVALTNALKGGQTVRGAWLVEGERAVLIR